jgi:hypothetical protein
MGPAAAATLRGRSSTVTTSDTTTTGPADQAGTTTEASSRRRPCFPDDPNYPDGYTEIDLPPERLLRAYFNTEILEPEGEPQPKIIHADDYFKVRFRVELKGELWYCICGDWWFDLGFSPTGAGKGFDLSNVLGREKFYYRNWRGCDTRCIELVIEVPPGTIPVEYCGTVYKCAAKVQLYCCGKSAAVVGFDDMGTFQFYKADIDED